MRIYWITCPHCGSTIDSGVGDSSWSSRGSKIGIPSVRPCPQCNGLIRDEKKEWDHMGILERFRELFYFLMHLIFSPVLIFIFMALIFVGIPKWIFDFDITKIMFGDYFLYSLTFILWLYGIKLYLSDYFESKKRTRKI